MIEQAAIFVTGLVAVYLSQSRLHSLRRYACIFGLAGQPFWLWAAWSAGQAGIFALSIAYTGVWLRGIWVHWIRP